MAEIDDEQIQEKREIEKRNKRRRERELSDIKHVLSTVEGRRLVWRLLSEAGIFRSTFNQNALVGALNEGRRDIGLVIWNDLNLASPERYQQMQREYVSDQKSEQK